MARKKKTLKFVLSEDGNLVRAILAIDGALILDFENEQASSVAVRHSIARESDLLETAKYWSRRSPAMGDAAGWLDRYVTSRERDVTKRILEIRKALRRIAGSLRNAKTAKRIKRELRR